MFPTLLVLPRLLGIKGECMSDVMLFMMVCENLWLRGLPLRIAKPLWIFKNLRIWSRPLLFVVKSLYFWVLDGTRYKGTPCINIRA